MVGSVSVLCGQLLVVGLEGTTLTTAEHTSLASGERGGVILFRRNVQDGLGAVLALNRAVRAAAAQASGPAPALVAVDQEGGRVMRLRAPVWELPPMRRLGDLRDADLVRRVAEGQARELAALGFTLSFAPIADVHTRDENPIIGDRAFATTPAGVAELAGAFAEGLAKGGVLSCAKHFPGHGDTTVDSHLALPKVERDRAGLDAIEIAAFRPLAKNPAVASMMTAHVVYPALDPDNPATLSRTVCTDLLRHELGFQGVLFSDDLEMKAIAIPVGEAAVRSILAGCDVLLVCSKADLAAEAHAALVKEAESSAAFRARCEEALARVKAMRAEGAARDAVPAADDAGLETVFASTATLRAELTRRLEAGR